MFLISRKGEKCMFKNNFAGVFADYILKLFYFILNLILLF